MNIIEKIDHILRPHLHESQHGSVLRSVLNDHGIARDDHEHILRGVADAHGIPKELVPQTVNHYLEGARTGTYPQRNIHATLNHYASLGGSKATYGDTSHDPRHMESSADQAKSWHGLATHKHGRDALNFGLISANIDKHYDHEEYAAGLEAFAAKSPDNFAFGHQQSHAALSGSDDHEPQDRAIHEYLVGKLNRYSPMRKDSWLHTWGNVEEKDMKAAADKHDASVDDVCTDHCTHVGAAHEALASLQGHKVPFKPDAEHTVNGTTYRGYTLDTPEKANDRCWGSKFCVATPGQAESANKMYHGGIYKTSHIITRVGESGEHVHAAYLPEMLPGQAHANPSQAVRNSGNSGAVAGAAFDKIRPLLSKLDSRIDTAAHHYRNGSSD